MQKHIRSNSTTNRLNMIGSVGYKINNNIDVLYRGNLQYLGGFSNGWTDGWSRSDIPSAAAINSGY